MKAHVNVSTRRRSMVAFAGALSSIACGVLPLKTVGQDSKAPEVSPDASHVSSTSLHEQIELPASPRRVFEVLMDEKQFAIVTGLPAKMDPTAGGAFKTFGGLIEGRNVELIPAQRIVQAWREVSWEPGFYSLVHFELTARGEHTTLILDHTGFHEGDFGHLNPGWYERYWEPLKRYLSR